MLHERKLLPLLFSICLYIHRFTFKARFVLKFNNFGWKHFWGRPGSRYQVPVPGSQACRYLVLVAAVPTRSLATWYQVPGTGCGPWQQVPVPAGTILYSTRYRSYPRSKWSPPHATVALHTVVRLTN